MTQSNNSSLIVPGFITLGIGYLYAVGYAYCRKDYDKIFNSPTYKPTDIFNLMDVVVTHGFVSLLSVITLPASPIIMYNFFVKRRFF